MNTTSPFDTGYWRSQPALFIDFEASGLHPDSYPIEVGVYASPELKYEALIAPTKHWTYWSNDAQDVHGIERSRLIREGISPLQVAKKLNELFAGKTLWADSNYDSLWMDVLFEAAGIEPRFSMGNLLSFSTDDNWSLFKRKLPAVTAHRALQDAKDIQDAWYKQISARIEEE